MSWFFWRRKTSDPNDIIADLQSDSAESVVRGLHRVLKDPRLFPACQTSIEKCFSHRKPHVRWFAAKVAAAAGGAAAAEVMALGLLDDGEIGSTTAQLLVNLGGRALPALKAFLWRDAARSNPAAIKRALDVLVQIDDNPVNTLFALLSSHTNQYVLERVIEFGSMAIPILVEGYRVNERGEAELVSEILGKLGDPGFHTLVDLLLERPPSAKRKILIAALWKKRGSFFDSTFFDGWRSADSLLDLLVELAQDPDRETALVSVWLIRECLPLASAEKREQIENSASFMLLGDLEATLRKALERVFQTKPDSLMLLAA